MFAGYVIMCPMSDDHVDDLSLIHDEAVAYSKIQELSFLLLTIDSKKEVYPINISLKTRAD